MFKLEGQDVDTATLQDLLAPAVASPYNHHFAMAVRQIAARGIGGRLGADRERLDIPVAVHITSHGEMCRLRSAWSCFQDLKTRYGGWRFPVELPHRMEEPTIDCAVVLGSIALYCLGDEMSPVSALLVEDMVTRGEGLTISELALTLGREVDPDDYYDEDDDEGDYEGDATEDALATGRLLERVLWASGCPSGACAAIQGFNLFCTLDSDTQFARACTAIAETQTTDALTLRFYPVSDDLHELQSRVQHAWEYLAYALFSRHARARSSMTTVELDGLEMSIADGYCIAAVVNSKTQLVCCLGTMAAQTPATAVAPAMMRTMMRDLLSLGC